MIDSWFLKLPFADNKWETMLESITILYRRIFQFEEIITKNYKELISREEKTESN